MQKIYLDNASTTPTDPEVVKAMKPYLLNEFGNASSPHSFGREAQKALEDARDVLAKFIGADSDEIIFTSGATESNNHAIFGVAQQLRTQGNHIIVSKIEHHSVLEPIEALKAQGFEVTSIDVDSYGSVDPQSIKDAIRETTILICVMHASNEIGTIQPVSQIGEIAKQKGICFLVDATQAVGHIPVNVHDLNADCLSLSAHKFYGPKGVGALYKRKGLQVAKFLHGGDQERDQRASTQNIPGIVGLQKAIELCREKMDEEISVQTNLRNRIIEEVTKNIEDVTLNGHRSERLPNNAHFSFDNIQGESLIMSLDMAGIAASMGSACTSGALAPSHTLTAIGLSDEKAFGSLRVTVGRFTKTEDVDYFLEKLPELVKTLRLSYA